MNIFLDLSIVIFTVLNLFIFFEPEKTKFNVAIIFILFTIGLCFLPFGVYELFMGKP